MSIILKNMKDEIFCEYLNMIHKIIERLAKNSFQIKAWTATIFAAIIVLTYSIINILIFFILIFTVSLFWALDSYYLKQEKLFRKLYEHKVNEYHDESMRMKIKVFDMSVIEYKTEVKNVPKTMISISELLFYIPFIMTLIIFLITYLTLNWQILIN